VNGSPHRIRPYIYHVECISQVFMSRQGWQAQFRPITKPVPVSVLQVKTGPSSYLHELHNKWSALYATECVCCRGTLYWGSLQRSHTLIWWEGTRWPMAPPRSRPRVIAFRLFRPCSFGDESIFLSSAIHQLGARGVLADIAHRIRIGLGP